MFTESPATAPAQAGTAMEVTVPRCPPVMALTGMPGASRDREWRGHSLTARGQGMERTQPNSPGNGEDTAHLPWESWGMDRTQPNSWGRGNGEDAAQLPGDR